MAKAPETIFKEKVFRDLRELPRTWFVKIQQMSIHGTPDILICINGQFIAIELKSKKKANITELQKYNLEKITQAGGVSVVTYPEIWHKTLDILTKLSRSLADEF